MISPKVLAVLATERKYQDSLGGDRVDGHVHSVGDELVLLKVYVDLALLAWSDNPGDEEALHAIRKVAGVCVRCMENHGALARR